MAVLYFLSSHVFVKVLGTLIIIRPSFIEEIKVCLNHVMKCAFDNCSSSSPKVACHTSPGVIKYLRRYTGRELFLKNSHEIYLYYKF